MLRPDTADACHARIHDPRWRSAPPSEQDVLTLLTTVVEGSRVLDGIVYCCQRKLVFRRVLMEYEPALYYVDPDNGFDEITNNFAPVTTSVDAAVRAIGSAWRVANMRYFNAEQNWGVSLEPIRDESIDGRQLAEYGLGSHRSLAIAMTMAVLHASLGEHYAHGSAISPSAAASLNASGRSIDKPAS